MIASISIPARLSLRALLAVAAQQMREIGRGLEMPAPAALDQLDAAPGIDLARSAASAARTSASSPTCAANLVDASAARSAANSIASTARIEIVGRRSCRGALQVERREGRFLAQLDPALPRQFERRDED